MSDVEIDREKALLLAQDSEFAPKRNVGLFNRTPKLNTFWKLVLAGVVVQFTTVYLCLRHKLDTEYFAQTQFPKVSLYNSYLGALETNLASNWSEIYAATPQLAGTNMEMVNWTKSKFEEFGFESEVDDYDVYISYPLDQSLSLLSSGNDSVVYEATLKEDVFEEDPNSSFFVPAFLGYSPSGDVTAEYVYCNYGTKQDFDTLEDLGVDLKGKIAVIRYGGLFRGLKVKFAQEHGMKAALLFTDPYDDGEVIIQNGYKAYPEGPARQASSLQRGSVQFLSYGPGDPTSPGYAIKPGESKSRSDPYYTVPRIPVLPISYREVTPILAKLSGYGPQVEGWNRGLIEGFDYSVGPNPDYKLHLFNEQEFNISTVHNVIGKIEGVNKDEVIIVGNHHDSWIPAAGDAHSGSVVMLELARGLNELTKLGWKPQRSIWLASWDGEEYGLLGSTEFGEYYANKLQKNVVAYLNMDVATCGSNLNMAASPLLYSLLRETADLLEYPDSDQSLYEHFQEVSKDRIQHLGSGSDYTVFLDHLGIPSIDIGFVIDGKTDPVYHYHSIYDSYTWMSEFGDPGFVFHNLMGKYIGLILLNLEETKVLGFKTGDYARVLLEVFDKVEVPTKWLNNEVKSMTPGCHGMAPEATLKLKNLVEQVKENLSSLLEQAVLFDKKSVELQVKYQKWDELSFIEKIKLKWAIFSTNKKLKYFERHFLNPDGLKERDWFKHIVFTSGRYTGYAGQQLPGLNEPIEDNDFDGFVDGISYFNKVLKTLLVTL